MSKEKATEKLFKAIYGAMIDEENQELEKDEIVTIALKTVSHFMNSN